MVNLVNAIELMEKSLHLKDLLSIEILQKVQDNFSDAMDIALVIVDEQGVPVTQPSGFSPFCLAIRDHHSAAQQCYKCDNAGGRKAMSIGAPIVYRCNCGLVEFAVPIAIHNHYLGAFASGQIRLEEQAQEKKLEYILTQDDSWSDDPKLVTLYKQAKVISFKKFQAAAYSLFHLATHLVEQGYSNKIQKKLHAKNLRLVDESRKRAELERSLQEAELQALSYQINPHFLFNVLNTIGRLAMLENAERTESTVYGFSDMLRYILRKTDNKLITLNSELTHVKNYMHLQQVRMGDRFSFEIDIPEQYLDTPCPFLILQPIVENCFNYVIEPRDEKSYIKITGFDDGTDVILEITDNGDGIAPDRINDALNGTAKRQNRTGLGIHNVSNRLKLSFGENYGLEIDSPFTQGGGTTVRIRCPMNA